MPTLNERDNVRPLIERITKSCCGIRWEIIFVDDDSEDGTHELIKTICLKNQKVHLIHRIGRRGLSSACIEGFLASSAPYLAVMDGDLQHDESLLPRMLQTLKEESLDIVVGSRYVQDGSMGDLSLKRKLISRTGSILCKLTLGIQLKDPMSGFFMVKREFLNIIIQEMSPRGFKILLEIFASAKGKIQFKELPYRFSIRTAGSSKLDRRVILEYGHQLYDKIMGNHVPLSFHASRNRK